MAAAIILFSTVNTNYLNNKKRNKFMFYSDRVAARFRPKPIPPTLDKSCEVTSLNENNRIISNSIHHALFKIQLSSFFITQKLKVASKHFDGVKV